MPGLDDNLDCKRPVRNQPLLSLCCSSAPLLALSLLSLFVSSTLEMLVLLVELVSGLKQSSSDVVLCPQRSLQRKLSRAHSLASSAAWVGSSASASASGFKARHHSAPFSFSFFSAVFSSVLCFLAGSGVVLENCCTTSFGFVCVFQVYFLFLLFLRRAPEAISDEEFRGFFELGCCSPGRV